MINSDRLTVKSTEALNDALSLARRNGNPLVYDLHLLSALLSQDEGIVVPIIQKLGVSVPTLREAVDREMARYGVTANAIAPIRTQRRRNRRTYSLRSTMSPHCVSTGPKAAACESLRHSVGVQTVNERSRITVNGP